MMTRETRISFPSGKENLEGIVAIPTDSQPPWPGTVISHPDPWMGGTMDSPVIRTISSKLTARKIATFRFNYRGVGESTGSYEEGKGESEDTHNAFDLLAEWPDINGKKLGLIGYSFGASMAALTTQSKKNATGLVLISPPLGLLDSDVLKKLSTPTVIISGEKDLMTPPEKLVTAQTKLPETTQLRFIPNADRSWSDGTDLLANTITEFFQDLWLMKG
jgi:alpha/beta superfamily hydrolase